MKTQLRHALHWLVPCLLSMVILLLRPVLASEEYLVTIDQHAWEGLFFMVTPTALMGWVLRIQVMEPYGTVRKTWQHQRSCDAKTLDP